MHPLIQRLCQDHVNMTKVLDMLAGQLEVLDHGGKPDYGLMVDIVDYIERYPDRVHHPIEDDLCQAYLKCCDKDHALIHDLFTEHKALIQMTKSFKAILELVLQDTPVTRETVSQTGQDYVTRQRRHLALEEEQVFPVIEDGLPEQAWRVIEQQAPATPDPLLGDTAYEALLEAVENTGKSAGD